ncbi:MAG: DNA polymerase III subunit gamma/tau [Patescibacteria group bacterium]|jgi:DNA polymerase-3 subunit gamma/tau
MSTTLYRKYRPQKFAEVVGQNHIKVTLQNEILTGKIAHAYLFSGPRGIGKTTIARILAKSLNCQNLQGADTVLSAGIEPCCQCASCLEIQDGRSLDLVEIDAASNRGINEIRELREQTKYTPVKEKYKVFIIDEVHMLTNEAFNALLKTLEEPPAHAIFILATTEIHKIPETIISRCQRFDFKKVPHEAAILHLSGIARQEEVNITGEVIENIARASDGYLRDAVSLLGQVLSLGEKEIDQEAASLVMPKNDWQKVMELITLVLSSKTKEALILVNQLFEEGLDLEHFAKITVETLRKILLSKVTNHWDDLVWEAGEEWLKKIVEATARLSSADLVKVLEIFLEALSSIKQAAIIQLPLEVAIIKSAAITDFVPVTTKQEVTPEPPSKKDPPVVPPALKDENIQTKKPVNKTGNPINIDEVKNKWPDVIEALREYNHALAAFLQVGQPISIEGDRITVGFQFNFHYERIKESKYLEIVHNVFERVFGRTLLLTGLVDGKFGAKAEEVKDNPVNRLEAVLEAFGGEVVG